MNQIYIWLIIAAVLFVTELVSGTFVIIFFALGALLTALLPWLSIENLSLQIGFFAVSSTALLLLFRKMLMKSFQVSKTGGGGAGGSSGGSSGGEVGSDVGQTLLLDADIPPKGTATVNYQGSPWTAINQEHVQLNKGQRVRISQVEGVTLYLKKES